MTSQNPNVLEICSISKRFCRDPKFAARYALSDIAADLRGGTDRSVLRPGEFWAVHDVSFNVKRGEVVGLIGHNGAGKSSLINIVSGILRPSTGSVAIYSDKVVLMDHSGGLSARQTGRENIGNILSMNGLHPREILASVEGIVAFSELREFIDAPVGSYSLGMRIRLSFAINARLRPGMFIVDEALNGGDFRFQMKFKQFLNDYVSTGGSILFASHDMFAVQSFCHSVVLMDHGKVVSTGDPTEVIHEYTKIGRMREKPAYSAVRTAIGEDNNVGGNGEDDTQPLDFAGTAEEVVTVESVSISAPDGGDLYPGRAALITVVCFSRINEENVICGCELGVGDLFPVASLAGGLETRFDLREGLNTFQCRIERLPLLPGNHVLTVVFLKQGGGGTLGVKGYNDEPVKFEVKGGADPLFNIAIYRKNLMHIPAEWEMSGTPVGESHDAKISP